MNRLKIIFAVMMVVATSLPQPLSAQKSARDVFNSMPDSLLPYLTSVNRADCIDFLDSNMRAKVKNRLGQESEMTELSADYIKMQMSPETTWQMKLLPLNDSVQVVCMVSTACATACDSHVDFYTPSWEKLPTADYLPALPLIGDFFSAEAKADESLAPSIAAFDIPLLKLDLSKDDTSLLITFTTADYVTPEVLKKVDPYLTRSVKYEWRDGKFER